MALKNRRVFELRLGKVGLILFIGGISILLFSIFLLGIVVGKHMEAYPERYASGIPDLIREHLFAPFPNADKSDSSAQDQKNRDELAAGADAAGTASIVSVGEKDKIAADVPSPASVEKPSEPSPALPLPEGRRAVEALARKTPPPQPPASGTSGAGKTGLLQEGERGRERNGEKRQQEVATKQRHGQYEVQVAAYREKRQAELLVKKFSNLGFAHRVVMKDLPGKGRWFRVIAGGFENREMAQAAADRMAAKVSGLKCIVRPADGDGRHRSKE